MAQRINDEYDYLGTFNELPENIREIILRENATWVIDYLIGGYEMTPIEIMLFIELEKENKKNERICLIEPQYQIDHDGRGYYADFMITNHPNDKSLKKEFYLVVECDGYEFHQKSKKQVDYDNQRAYDLKLEGFDILRFSGTEIYNNANKVADKIFKYIKGSVGLNGN